MTPAKTLIKELLLISHSNVAALTGSSVGEKLQRNIPYFVRLLFALSK